MRNSRPIIRRLLGDTLERGDGEKYCVICVRRVHETSAGDSIKAFDFPK